MPGLTDGTTSSSDGEGERNSSGGAFSSLDRKFQDMAVLSDDNQITQVIAPESDDEIPDIELQNIPIFEDCSDPED